MMAPNTERPLDGGEGHAGKTARGPRHGDPTDVRCRGRRRGRRGRNTRVSKSAKGLMVVPFGRGGDWTAGNLLKIGHQHQTRILLATNMGNAPGVRLAQPLKKYGGIASALIACLSLAYDCNYFLWAQKCVSYLPKAIPSCCSPVPRAPSFRPSWGPRRLGRAIGCYTRRGKDRLEQEWGSQGALPVRCPSFWPRKRS